MKLIDKDAVVAEINALLDDEFKCNSYDEATGFQNALTLVKKFIDTLEVKEMNSNDAFIEKACEWIRDNFLLYPSEDYADIKMFVKDFRKYMKGE